MAAPPPIPDSRLESGLLALKRRDYAAAIATLSSLVHQKQVPKAQRLKAEMGLVQAHMGLGDQEKAIAQCQALRRYPQPQVQQWVDRMLATLVPSNLVPSNLAPSNVEAQDSPPDRHQPETSPGASRDSSGFRPLAGGADPEAAVPGAAASGFVPLTPAPSGTVDSQSLGTTENSTAAMPPVISSPRESGTPDPLTAALAPESPPLEMGTVTPGRSLFHYDTLNQDQSFEALMAGRSEPASPESSDPGEGESPVPGAGATVKATPEARPARDGGSRADTDSGMDSGTGAGTHAMAISIVPSASPSDAPWQLGAGERLERLQPLPGPERPWELWLAQGVTLGLVVGLWRLLIHRGLALLNWTLMTLGQWLPMPRPGWVYGNYTWEIIGTIGLLLVACPWLLDWGLSYCYGQGDLSLQPLKTSHPEAVRLLRRIGQQRGWPIPLLKVLPLDTPLMFSYGWGPKTLRIVVSRGALTQLDDQELTTLYGRELAHCRQGTVGLMSLFAVMLLGLHQVYWQLAQWGDRLSVAPLRPVFALLSAIAYGLYWMGRKPLLALARARTMASDRLAVSWTGNPAGLVRAWVKIAQGTATSFQQQGYLHPLVESLDLFTPLGYRSALTPGSLGAASDLPTCLGWDWQNPYRHWLALNSAHPPLGDRIASLNRHCQSWNLTPEMPLAAPQKRLRVRSAKGFWDYWRPVLLQIAPYVGPFLGAVTALVLWFLGGFLGPLGLWWVGWLYGDRALLVGSIYLGIGIGILLRINAYFPDITSRNQRKNPPLDHLLRNPMALPTDSTPLDIQGILLGRRGIANWLCQDLWLQTPQGVIKIHFFSLLGAAGNLLIHPKHPVHWVGQPVQLLGWFRRGAEPWIDVERLVRSRKSMLIAQHPLWSSGLALLCCGLGIVTLLP